MKTVLTAAATAAACAMVRHQVEKPGFGEKRWGRVCLRPMWNQRGAFGLPVAGRTLAVPSLLALGLVWCCRHNAPVSAGLVLGGGGSNLLERLRRGMVCDYLRVQKGPGFLGRYVYNLADLAIFTGALGLVLFSRRDGLEITPKSHGLRGFCLQRGRSAPPAQAKDESCDGGPRGHGQCLNGPQAVEFAARNWGMQGDDPGQDRKQRQNRRKPPRPAPSPQQCAQHDAQRQGNEHDDSPDRQGRHGPPPDCQSGGRRKTPAAATIIAYRLSYFKMAPSEPEAAILQYRPSQPFLNLGSGRFQALSRASISSWGTFSSRLRLSTSMTIRSPS